MYNLRRLEEKVAIVTGAGSGMGRSCVIRLSHEGARVIAVDVNEEGLKETCQLAGKESWYIKASVSDEHEVKRMVEEVVSKEGRIDVLVNMAGILRSSETTETTLEQFMLPIQVNLVGTFLTIRETLPHLIKTKGNIVNAASTSAFFGHPYMSGYSASKGGVVALTKALAWEYLKQGVRVNAVAPGGIETGMTTKNPLENLGNKVDYSLLEHLGRPGLPMGQAEDVSGVVAMLASADGNFCTGEIIKIDGGNHN